eukprot:2613734-Pyramimonas_sp.AAC.1
MGDSKKRCAGCGSHLAAFRQWFAVVLAGLPRGKLEKAPDAAERALAARAAGAPCQVQRAAAMGGERT